MASAIVYCNSSSQDVGVPQWVNLSRIEGAPSAGVLATATTSGIQTPATITVGFPAFSTFPGPVTQIEIGATTDFDPIGDEGDFSVLGSIGVAGASFNDTLKLQNGEAVRTRAATIIDVAAATAGLEAGVTGLELAPSAAEDSVFSLAGVFLRVTYTEGQIIGGGGDTGSAKALPLNLVLP